MIEVVCMAYANQNQGVFVPYHQLIDLRSLNQPVTFVTGPPIALNFINPSNGTVLVPPKPTLVPSFGFALDPAFLVRIEEARSRSLLQFSLWQMKDLCLLQKRKLGGKMPLRSSDRVLLTNVGFTDNILQMLLPLYEHMDRMALEVHNSELDIDALCVGPCFATLARIFFVFLHNMLTSRTEVSEVHCVKDAKVPLMQFKLDGISFDLPYAQLKVMSIPELSVMHVEPTLSKQSIPTVVSAYTQGSHNVDILNPFFQSNIDEKSWRSLSGVHANKCILRLLPNMEVSSMLSMGSYGASDQDELRKWVGWVKSQFCSLLVKSLRVLVSVFSPFDIGFQVHIGNCGFDSLLTPSISCGRFDLLCTKNREARIHLQGPPFTVEAFKTKQQTGHPPASIASCCGENDVEMDKAHPNAKVYRKKGVDYIDLLDVLFANSQATSALARASTQGPPTSHEERDIQSAFFGVGNNSNTDSIPIGDDIDGDDDLKVGGSSGNDGGRKGAHLDLALDTWTATNFAKKKFYARQNKMAEASQAEKKQYSIDACMDCLATMDGITPD
ncbi:unnamed protein product [Camellia sinensis]